MLYLTNIKKTLRYVPIKSEGNDFIFSHPLGKVKRSKGYYRVYIGNKLVTKLRPQYFKIAKRCQKSFDFVVDGEKRGIQKASIFFVNDDFVVSKNKSYRVNVIGFSSKHKDESGIPITLRKLDKRYSVDKDGKVYRIEFYKDNTFCTMILAHFE